MIYVKPTEAVRLILRANCTYAQETIELAKWAASFPAEFEILGPKERAVVWPADLTRERLLYFAGQQGLSAEHYAFKALAAIAPEAPKKRMVVVWEGPDKTLEVVSECNKIFANSAAWKKVGGPFEIEG